MRFYFIHVETTKVMTYLKVTFISISVNAYICYKNTFVVQKKMDHLAFQKELISGLIGNFRQGKSRRGRQSLQSAVRLTARHFIELIPEKRRLKCLVCAGKRNKFSGCRVRTWCPDCQVGLCLGTCFKNYHTRTQYEEWTFTDNNDLKLHVHKLDIRTLQVNVLKPTSVLV